jgi:hypothetical protein
MFRGAMAQGNWIDESMGLSAVTQTDPPRVEMKGFKMTHLESGGRAANSSGVRRMGWGIRKIARQLGLSRNTVSPYARSVEVLSAEALAEEILKGSPPSFTIETDPLSTPGSATLQNQTDPLSTAGNTGRKSLCACDRIYLLPKALFDDRKGSVAEGRRHLIARKIVEVLRLPLHRK